MRTQIQSLVREDPTCYEAAKPVSHNCWAQTPRAHAPKQEKPLQWEVYALQLEKAHMQERSPVKPKVNK